MKDTPVTAARLLAMHDQVAEAEDAIPRLRRFVLDLAVRGKLVEQDAADEPAAELLKRIAKETAWLIADGKIKRTKSHPMVGDDTAENPPNGWKLVSGNEVFFSRSGNSKLIKGQLHSEPGDNRFAGYSAAGQDVWLDHWEHEGIAVILSAVGARCGKAFLANGRWSAVANTHIVWLMPSITMPAYAMLHLNNEDFWIRSGGAQPFIKVNETLERAFPLPPLAEQHRILAKVDELMALCDQLEQARAGREAVRDRLTAATWARMTAPETDAETFPTHARFALQTLPTLTTRPDQIKTLRQTILNLAVRGKLVEQDPTNESAAELLRRIVAGRLKQVKAGKLKPPKPLDAVNTVLAPFELPVGWAWARFPELGTFGRGKSKHRPRNDNALFEGGTHLMIQTGDVARSQGVIETHTSKYNDFGLAQSMKWPAGTMCITIAANIADTGILAFDACFPDSVVGFIPAELFQNARYFEYFVRTAKANLLEFAPATAQKNINLEILTSVLIPLPPLAELHRIVTHVDALMTLCDQLEASLTIATTTRSRLLEVLLHETLGGQAGVAA